MDTTFAKNQNRNSFSWGVGPYLAHRLFNPDLPLSMETGIELLGLYSFNSNLKLTGNT